MAKFWELVQQSIIVQSIITLELITAVIFMFAIGRDVPDALVNMTMLILGFWFGTKIQGGVNNIQYKKVIKEVMENGKSRVG